VSRTVVRGLRYLLWLFSLTAVALLGGFFWLGEQMSTPGARTEPVILDVQPGEPLRGVLLDLERQGALPDARLVELWARLADQVPRVKVGRYLIAVDAAPRDILQQLDDGRVLLESLTVIEGTRFDELRGRIAAHPGLRQTLTGVDDAELMRRLGAPGVHPEGRFFPDTYRFAWGSADFEVLKLAYERMQRSLAEAWAMRSPELPLKTPDEALILASIIEKESALAEERPRVAGVFVQRLRLGMRLQSDPTVIYGLRERYDGDIRSRDLVTDTPYNSYTRKGLPPTPIALPGAQALRAATRPLETGELFFVATGLPDGSHTFSRTYDDHRQAVRVMLERQRARRVPP
jgi:UPF0755 protein